VLAVVIMANGWRSSWRSEFRHLGAAAMRLGPSNTQIAVPLSSFSQTVKKCLSISGAVIQVVSK
jgi:hypothetical protein